MLSLILCIIDLSQLTKLIISDVVVCLSPSEKAKTRESAANVFIAIARRHFDLDSDTGNIFATIIAISILYEFV
jgi:hypothetical protein